MLSCDHAPISGEICADARGCEFRYKVCHTSHAVPSVIMDGPEDALKEKSQNHRESIKRNYARKGVKNSHIHIIIRTSSSMPCVGNQTTSLNKGFRNSNWVVEVR